MARHSINSDGKSGTTKRNSTAGSETTLKFPQGLREKNGKIEIRFQYLGKTHSEVTSHAATAQNIPFALARMVAMKEEARNGTVPKGIVHVPLSKACSLFLEHYGEEHKEHPNTVKRTRTSLVACCRYWHKDPFLDTMNAADVDDFKLHRGATDQVANPTVHNDLCNLSLVFQFGKKRNWCKANPVEDVDLPSVKNAVRMNILKPDFFRLYLAEAQRRSMDLADMATIMSEQGTRDDETLHLEQAAVDLEQSTFKVLFSKTDAGKRRLRMTRNTRNVLKRRLQIPGKWVFPSPRKPWQPVSNIYTAHNDVLAMLGIDEHHQPELLFVPYDLRHTFATRMACAGCPLPTLARILGHGNLTTIYKYVHPSQEMMDEAMRKYAETGEQPEPPPLPIGARGFEDIAEPLASELFGPTQANFQANFRPTSPSKTGGLRLVSSSSKR